MATETPTRRVVVYLTDEHYRRLQEQVEARSNAIRKATVVEVVRSLIDEHLPASAG